jgi:endonuclease G, mitochondrial
MNGTPRSADVGSGPVTIADRTAPMMLPALLDSEPALRRELETRLSAGINLLDAERLGVSLQTMRAAVAGQTPPDPLATRLLASFARPLVPIGVTLADVESRHWHRRLTLAGREIARAADAVARVWLEGHPVLQWAGTCWFVTNTIAVTTRGIADECRRQGVKARIEHGGRPFSVVDIRTMDDPPFGSWLAFLVVEEAHRLDQPWRLSGREVDAPAWVVTITYSARDSRTGDPLLDEVYARSFNQRCVAPGRLLTASADSLVTHDCAAVGNSAGGVIVDLATGDPVGLHLGGALEKPSTGIPWAVVDRRLRSFAEPIVVTGAASTRGLEARATVEDYEDRVGYRSDFLGVDVPPPIPTRPIRGDTVSFTIRGESAALLPYTHFSVCMSESRRMCRFAACNVEGGNLESLPRAGIPWRFDPRLDEERQAGNDLYVANDLDRGHMVRRLDPVWGDDAEAANEDTFHYTNSCPQHKDLNQQTWNDLEDYVLDNAGKHRLNINVFTGPVFRPEDPEYRDFQLPLDFWKVVVMVKDDGSLSATAYTLSQRDLVSGLEFAFGEFRTYQVPLKLIEEWTQLDFGELRRFDPKETQEAATAIVRIDGPGDIQL